MRYKFYSKKRRSVILLSMILLSVGLNNGWAQSPVIEWAKVFGGSASDQNAVASITSDGGFIAVGNSPSTNGDITEPHGGTDMWVVKGDAQGNLQWQKSLGGTGTEGLLAPSSTAIIEIAGGGYMLAGYTASSNGDVHGFKGGIADAWVVKLNSAGDTVWTKCYGGTALDQIIGMRPTPDGGYVFVGRSESSDGDVPENKGADDVWVFKINAEGSVQWSETYGGSGADRANSIWPTSDGGFILVGSTNSNNTGDISGFQGGHDVWLLKINATGSLEWQKCLGGTAVDVGHSVIQDSDGNYLVAGYAISVDGDVVNPKGGNKADYWVVKLTSTGTILWANSYGGTDVEWARSIRQTSDGGYVIAGDTRSNNGDLDGFKEDAGGADWWIVKINNAGVIEWQKVLDSKTTSDQPNSIELYNDGSFLIAGQVAGTGTGNFPSSKGNADYGIVKLSACPAHEYRSISICAGDNYDFNGILLTQAGVYRDTLASTSACPNYIELTLTLLPLPVPTITQSGNTVSTGNYSTYNWLLNKQPLTYATNKQSFTAESSNDYQLVVTDANGCKSDTTEAYSFIYNGCEAPVVDWSKSYGGTGADQAWSITAVSDGYLVSGRTASTNGDVKGLHGTANDFWVLKINNSGDTLWTKTLGGNGADNAYAIRATSDGGFIVVGESVANATTGTIGSTPRPVASSTTDVWVIKFTSLGAIDWQQLYGGTGVENAYSIEPTSDGYIISGSVVNTSTTGTLTGVPSNGGNDGWILKLNTDGTLAWQQRLGGAGAEHIYSIKPTSDGGYIAVGYSQYNATTGTLGSTPRPVPAGGGEDAWIIKLDNTGTTQWQQLFGGSGNDRAYSVKPTSDGGYMVSGYAAATSTNGTLDGVIKPGNNDFWILKLDNTGTIQWQKALGGAGSDQSLAYDLIVETDGYVFTGLSASTDGAVTGNKGNSDHWVVKTDLTGAIQWQKSLGGTGADQANSITVANDGGYIIAGHVSAGGIADAKGGQDFYITKVKGFQNCTEFTEATICQGTTYSFHGTDYTTEGDHITTVPDGDATLTQALRLHVNPTYTTSQTEMICDGDTYNFYGTILTIANTYTHVLQSIHGCDSTIVLTLTLNPLPTPTITASGSTLSTGAFSSYQWLLDDAEIDGATSQMYTATENGNYKVVVTDGNGCSDMSAVFAFTATGIWNAVHANGISVHPNPVDHELNIALTSNTTYEISLSNLQGQEVLYQEEVMGSTTVDVQALPSGIYLLKIWENETLRSVQKIVKK